MNADELELPANREVVVSARELPAGTLVLVDDSFVAHLNETEEITRTLIVRDDVTQTRAANLLNELTKAATQVEKTRKQLKQPFLDFGRKIDGAADTVVGRISTLKGLLSGKLTKFQMEEEAKARELERERQAEIRRLEEKARRDLEAERKRLADEAEKIRASMPKVQEMDFEMPAAAAPTAVEARIAQMQATPAVVAAKPAGARWIVGLKFTVEDANKLPADYQIVTANLPKLRGLTAGWKEGQPIPSVPGCKFYEDRQFVGTGR